MKQIPILTNAILAIVLVIILLSAGLPALTAQAASPSLTPTPAVQVQPVCDSSRTVQVSGSALINVTPDRALIQLGVQSNGLSPDAVQVANSAATVFKRIGI